MQTDTEVFVVEAYLAGDTTSTVLGMHLDRDAARTQFDGVVARLHDTVQSYDVTEDGSYIVKAGRYTLELTPHVVQGRPRSSV